VRQNRTAVRDLVGRNLDVRIGRKGDGGSVLGIAVVLPTVGDGGSVKAKAARMKGIERIISFLLTNG
jgi:hypothetical protein